MPIDSENAARALLVIPAMNRLMFKIQDLPISSIHYDYSWMRRIPFSREFIILEEREAHLNLARALRELAAATARVEALRLVCAAFAGSPDAPTTYEIPEEEP